MNVIHKLFLYTIKLSYKIYKCIHFFMKSEIKNTLKNAYGKQPQKKKQKNGLEIVLENKF